VQIVAQWPGHAAEEVERLITIPLEVEMNGIPKLDALRSISLYGLSSVTMNFQYDTDPYFARGQAFERIADAQVPAGVTPGMSPLFSPSGLIYRYVLQSPDRSAQELKILQDWVLERRYRAIQGVADDSSLGGETMQYQVQIDPHRLMSYGVTVPQIVQQLANNNANAGGGFFPQGGQFYYVRGLGLVKSLEDIGNIVIASRGGIPVSVRDVGTVAIGSAPRLGQFGYMRQNDAVEGVILMRVGEQAQVILKKVQEVKDKRGLNRHCPVKWNMRDLDKALMAHDLIGQKDILIGQSNVLRTELLAALAAAGATIFTSAILAYSNKKQVLGQTREDLVGYSFGNLLMRVGLFCKEGAGGRRVDVLLDWPERNDRSPFTSEYYTGWRHGRSGPEGKAVTYQCGALTDLAFSPAPMFAGTEFEPRLSSGTRKPPFVNVQRRSRPRRDIRASPLRSLAPTTRSRYPPLSGAIAEL
jgi:hypothetical protein